jgi:hypothetical protein
MVRKFAMDYPEAASEGNVDFAHSEFALFAIRGSGEGPSS